MANFTYQGTADGEAPGEMELNVAVSGTASTIKIGDIVVVANGYASQAGNGGCVTRDMIYGLAVSDSTEAVAAEGTVKFIYSHSGLILRGTPTTPANLAVGILFDNVSLDLSGTTQTVDENDPSAAYCLKIMDYNTTNGTIDVALAAEF
jgi:hypothetical protein